MSTNAVEGAIVKLNQVISAVPDRVSPSRWGNWKLWKQAADAAEEEYKKQSAAATSDTVSEQYFQLADRSGKALASARASFLQLEQMVSALPQTDGESPAAQLSHGTIPSNDVQMENLKVELPVGGPSNAAPATVSPMSSAMPAASSSSLTSPANGSASKGQQPVIFDPPCDNCRGAGAAPCVRSPPPHHRRCTRCAGSNMRCSFKEAKATAAAAQAAASEHAPAPVPRERKRKRFVVPEYDEDASYTLVKAPRRASAADGGLRRRVQEAQSLVRTIGFLFERLDDALEEIAEAAGVAEDSTPA